eukprot:15332688-Ditylum_brightwellii.AAC.1
MLLHAKQYWPEYITTMLWPNALKMTGVYCNKFDVAEDGSLPEEKFSNVCSVQSLTAHHTWGCPVCILDACLQDRSGTVHKWDPRVRHVSPQFHVVFDDTFSTVPHLRSGTVSALWKELVESNSADLKGTLTESTWELPDEDSPILSPLQHQTNDSPPVDTEPQPASQPKHEHVVYPSLPMPKQLPAMHKREDANHKGEKDDHKGAKANHKEESKQDLHMQMPKMIDLFSTGLRHSTRTRKAPV